MIPKDAVRIQNALLSRFSSYILIIQFGLGAVEAVTAGLGTGVNVSMGVNVTVGLMVGGAVGVSVGTAVVGRIIGDVGVGGGSGVKRKVDMSASRPKMPTMIGMAYLRSMGGVAIL